MGSWVQAQHEMVGSFYKFDLMKFLKASNANRMAIWFARVIALRPASPFLDSIVKILLHIGQGASIAPSFSCMWRIYLISCSSGYFEGQFWNYHEELMSCSLYV